MDAFNEFYEIEKGWCKNLCVPFVDAWQAITAEGKRLFGSRTWDRYTVNVSYPLCRVMRENAEELNLWEQSQCVDGNGI